MSAKAMGLLDDLRRRRLLPVAVLLLVVLIALPLFALKSAPEGAAVPPPAPAATGSPAGLPEPEQALSGEKPLVSLAVLNESSNLDSFEPKNPFKPLKELASVSEGGAAPTNPMGAPPAADLGGGTTTGGGGSPQGGGGSPQGGGGGSAPGTPSPSPSPNGGGGGGPAPTPAPKTNPEPRRTLTYALDMTIRGPQGLRRYRGLPKLSVLPSADNPLFVFLGIEDAGNKAVFLVDAKLRTRTGEGVCTPSPAQCATLALAPGEEHVLENDQGQAWTLQIVEVRATTVAKAAAAARRAQRQRAREARRATRAVGAKQPAPRFIPPIITDLFTGGRS